MLVGFLTGCLAGAPLVVIYCFVAKVPQLALLIVVMNIGVGMIVGFVCAWMMLKRKPRQKLMRAIRMGALSGAVVVTVQYAVVPAEWSGLGLFGPFWGWILGGIGAAGFLLLQGPRKRRQSVTRSRQVSTFLHRAGKEWTPDKDKTSQPILHDGEEPET